MYRINVPAIQMRTDRRFRRIYKIVKEFNPTLAQVLWDTTFAAKSVAYWSDRDPEYADALRSFYDRQMSNWNKTLDEEMAVEFLKYQISDL